MDIDVLLTNLRSNWDDPHWWRDIAYPFILRNALVKPYFNYLDGDRGTAVMTETWDNLLILDACRFDMFEELHDLPGVLEHRISKGSNTAEFLKRNFTGGQFHDTVYVTANPQVDVRLDDPFYRTVSVWRDYWDEEINTVRPQAMAEATVEAAKDYPNKRIISHFVQPHYPFIGPGARDQFDDQAGIEFSKRMAKGETAVHETTHVWDLLKRGAIDETTVDAAYRENLEVALPHIEDLVETLTGTTVVTSDHGNLLGEVPRPFPLPVKLYGHPAGVYSHQLVKVPWLVANRGESRSIEADAPLGGEEPDDTLPKSAEDRLRDLGYV